MLQTLCVQTSDGELVRGVRLGLLAAGFLQRSPPEPATPPSHPTHLSSLERKPNVCCSSSAGRAAHEGEEREAIWGGCLPESTGIDAQEENAGPGLWGRLCA